MKSRISIYRDILCYYYNDFFRLLPEKVRRGIRGDNWKDYSYNIGQSIFKAFKDLFSDLEPKAIAKKDWIVILGQNNYHSLEFLEDAFEEIVYVCPYRPKIKELNCYQFGNRFRLFWMIWRLPLTIKLLLEHKSKECPDRVFEAGGLFESYVSSFRRLKPKSLSFSNDHNLRIRAMILAAQHLKIPTYYVQHACVLKYFPPLRFTHSFLEGQDSLDKYLNAGKAEGEIHLVGIPRMDKHVGHLNKNKKVKKIGICSSTLDSLEAILSVLKTIRARFPEIELSYRPHPGDHRKIDLEAMAVNFSDSKKETAFEFLKNLDMIVAGNSSIHYEALSFNVVPVYYKYDSETPIDDIYDFCRKGKVKKTENIDDLCAYVQLNMEAKQHVIEHAKYFNAAIGSKFEGKSALETIRLIRENS